MRSGRSHTGGPFSGTRIADVSTPSMTSAPVAASAISTAVTTLLRPLRSTRDSSRSGPVGRVVHGARAQVRRHDPTVGERCEAAADAAGGVEHREERAGAHRTVAAAQMVDDCARRLAMCSSSTSRMSRRANRMMSVPMFVGRLRSRERPRRDGPCERHLPASGTGVDSSTRATRVRRGALEHVDACAQRTDLAERQVRELQVGDDERLCRLRDAARPRRRPRRPRRRRRPAARPSSSSPSRGRGARRRRAAASTVSMPTRSNSGAVERRSSRAPSSTDLPAASR